MSSKTSVDVQVTEAYLIVKQSYRNGRWTEITEETKQGEASPYYFVAYERSRSRSTDTDDVVTWIEVNDVTLLVRLKKSLPLVASLYNSKPGVDVRNVYHVRHQLGSSGDDEDGSHNATRVFSQYLQRCFDKVQSRLAQFPNDCVSWSLLWSLYQPGSLLRVNHDISGEMMAVVVVSWDFEEDANGRTFVLQGYYFQFAGTGFQRVATSIRISEFADIRPLSSLPAVPLGQSAKSLLEARGRKYMLYAKQVYASYTGSFFVQPLGGAMRLLGDGPVMIDVLSFRKANPGLDEWRDDVNNPGARNVYVPHAPDLATTEDKAFSVNEVCLLPPTIHGFSFRSRRWGEFAVQQLEPMVWSDKSFEHLVISPSHRRMISSLVKVYSSSLKDKLLRDVVRGKGDGLIIAVHGPPGTGKTLTAEAVSEHLRRPLYSVSAGELPTNPAALEKELRTLLDLVSKWDAVLLIDEADLFLEQRTNNNIERNALVVVFLRILEYFSGVVIMTSNRLHALDEAFKSRFALSLLFPELDRTARATLWGRFLAMTETSLSDIELDELSQHALNGREIKRTLQTAQALALADDTTLSMEHLREAIEVGLSGHLAMSAGK